VETTKAYKVTRLQNSILYGPVSSRRLGRSLGLNILPLKYKLCNFDCPYCQLGWTPRTINELSEVDFELPMPTPEEFEEVLGQRLEAMASAGEPLDFLTFSGNGEPTLHPQFPQCVDVANRVRDRYYPTARTSVLSNSATVDRPEVRQALMKLDERYMKLDAGRPEDIQAVNLPHPAFNLEKMIRVLKLLDDLVIQAMFVRGSVDNTGDQSVDEWIRLLAEVRPKSVQIYTLDRRPADRTLTKVDRSRLVEIARLVRSRTVIPAEVF